MERLNRLIRSIQEVGCKKLSIVTEQFLNVFYSSEGYIKHEKRQEQLRPDILKRVASLLMTDDERAAFFGLPHGCRIREGAKIISPEKLTIGEFCWIGEGAVLDASGELEIGSHTSIGLNVMVWTHDSHKLNLRGQNTPEKQNQIRRKKTKIGSNCFIAGPSVIMPGVTIGDFCIIGPGSIVYNDLFDRTVFQPYKDFHESLKRLDKLEGQMNNLLNNLNKNL